MPLYEGGCDTTVAPLTYSVIDEIGYLSYSNRQC